MTTIDPSALLAPLQAGIAGYQGPAPAILIEVAQGGLRAEAAAGVLSVDQDTLATTDATFQIGSQTKMMTAAVVLQLAAEGHFALDDKLSDVMDVSHLAGIANIQEATLRQLLTHSSGIPDYLNDFINAADFPMLWERLLEDPPRPVGPDEAIAFMLAQNAPAEFAPGERTDYSNTGYLLFQLAIEHVTGSPLADVLQERIFDPLGMEDTSYPGFERPDGIISSYANLDGTLLDVTHFPVDDAGDGGVVSTTADMIKFMQALVLDRTLVPESQLDALGHFFDAVGYSEGDLVGHSGGATGTTSVTLVHMPTGTVVSVALTHAGDVENLSALVDKILPNGVADHAWSKLQIDEAALDFALTAAELGISERRGETASAEVIFEMDGVSFALDSALAEVDTGSLTFEDGSTVFVAEAAGSVFSISQDALAALHAENHLIGRAGSDVLTGAFGNDMLNGGAGDDNLHGGGGHDTARFEGNQSDHTLVLGPEGVTLTDRSGRSGSDTLTSIEQLDFASGSFDLADFHGITRATASDLLALIELYAAYFNRAPDAVGLSFWATAMGNGLSLSDVATLFMDQDETREKYPADMPDGDFIETVYQSVLGRSADAAGHAFWLEKLNADTQGVSDDQFIRAILDGAKAAPQSQATDPFVEQQHQDRAFLANKAEIGTYFAVTLGMSNVENATEVMEVFDGSQGSINAAVAVVDAQFEDAAMADGGAFLMPVVGVLDNPFA